MKKQYFVPQTEMFVLHTLELMAFTQGTTTEPSQDFAPARRSGGKSEAPVF